MTGRFELCFWSFVDRTFGCFISILSLNDAPSWILNLVFFVIIGYFLFTFRCDFIVTIECQRQMSKLLGLKISCALLVANLILVPDASNIFEIHSINWKTVIIIHILRLFGAQPNVIADAIVFLFTLIYSGLGLWNFSTGEIVQNR